MGSYLLVLDTATRLPVRSGYPDRSELLRRVSHLQPGRDPDRPGQQEGDRAPRREHRQSRSVASCSAPEAVLSASLSAPMVIPWRPAHRSGDVEVYDLQNEPLTAKVPTGTTSVAAVAFSADGKVAGVGRRGWRSFVSGITTTWQDHRPDGGRRWSGPASGLQPRRQGAGFSRWRQTGTPLGRCDRQADGRPTGPQGGARSGAWLSAPMASGWPPEALRTC